MSAPWRLAESLRKLREQVNNAWPLRSKVSDGSIGNAEHASRDSDHNPYIKDARGVGVVTAIDVTNDPDNGCDSRKLAEALVASRDPRIKYVISNGQICSSKVQPWIWRKYSGPNGHFHHLHISVDASPALYDSTADWNITPAVKVNDKPELKKGSKGSMVVLLQQRLIKYSFLSPDGADGIFGEDTRQGVIGFQSWNGLPQTGIVDKAVWAKLLA